MSGYFEPSPRASKRRRTATYKATKSILDEGDNIESTKSRAATEPKRTADATDEFIDSAYGSKEDSLIEDGSFVVGSAVNVNSTSVATEPERSRNVHDLRPANATNEVRGSTPPASPLHSDDEENEDHFAIQTRSSGREKRRPRRYSISPEKPKARKTGSVGKLSGTKSRSGTETRDNSTVSITPKGILTPSRKEKRTGPRKSVVFHKDEKEIEQRFGFKDINSSGEKRKSTSKTEERDAIPDLGDVSTNNSQTNVQHESTLLTSTIEEDETDDNSILPEHFNEGSAPPVDLHLDISALSGISIGDNPAVLGVKAAVLAQMMRHASAKIPLHIKSQYETLLALLTATVTSGESNSLLLLGARGSGKTHLLEIAIHDLSTQHHDKFHTIRLNGFYQTDDRVALREIWRQLGREMMVDEMESGESGGSYADTMSSLLSLLSHPDEFIDHTAYGRDVMEIDSDAVRTSKSIIFILDEFDLFTTHPRQTLLYNLFDIAQSKKAPIAVIGCSTRMNVVDCLEKRVKSRFSHRWIHIPGPKTLTDFEDAVKVNLCIEELRGIDTMTLTIQELEARQNWNQHIQSALLGRNEIKDLIKRVYHTSKSIPEILMALYVPVATFQPPSSMSKVEASSSQPKPLGHIQQPDMVSLLKSLPTLHLCLLVAASRLDTIHNLTTLNFNLAYAHYAELIARSKLQVTASGAVAVGASLRQWNRKAAMSAWEDLGSYECIVPMSGTVIGASSKDGGTAGGSLFGGESASARMWRVDVTLEELSWAVKEKWTESGGVKDVLLRWCKEI